MVHKREKPETFFSWRHFSLCQNQGEELYTPLLKDKAKEGDSYPFTWIKVCTRQTTLSPQNVVTSLGSVLLLSQQCSVLRQFWFHCHMFFFLYFPYSWQKSAFAVVWHLEEGVDFLIVQKHCCKLWFTYWGTDCWAGRWLLNIISHIGAWTRILYLPFGFLFSLCSMWPLTSSVAQFLLCTPATVVMFPGCINYVTQCLLLLK